MIKAAVAQQEEYLKRQSSCGGVLRASHSWDSFSSRPGTFYQACFRCRVTKTDADYQTKMEA